jgi:hypothetical protein
VPALVLGTALPERRLHLRQVYAPLAVLRREDDRRVPADPLTFGVPEQAADAGVPADHASVEVGREDGEVADVLRDETEELLTVP